MDQGTGLQTLNRLQSLFTFYLFICPAEVRRNNVTPQLLGALSFTTESTEVHGDPLPPP